MFTGIIRDIGTITRCENQSGGLKITIQTQLSMENWAIGASVACSGACLTIVEKQEKTFSVEVSPESLARTNLKQWQVGTRVNLEPALKMGDALDGHLVAGHVDGLAKLQTIEQKGNSWHVVLNIPTELQKFVAEKGSITVDGVSLTVNDVHDPLIDLMIIPHSWANTCFQFYKAGDLLNIEVDLMARYAARLATSVPQRAP